MQSLTSSREASHSNIRFSTTQNGKSLGNQGGIYGTPSSPRTHTGNALVAVEGRLIDVSEVNGDAIVDVGNSNHCVVTATPDSKRTARGRVTTKVQEGESLHYG